MSSSDVQLPWTDRDAAIIAAARIIMRRGVAHGHIVRREERGRTASHRPGTQGCAPVPPARAAGLGQPRSALAGARRGTGPNVDVAGAVIGTAELPTPAGMAVQPVRAGGDVSVGSSPRSPPGKKARAAEESPPLTSWESLPRRETRPDISRRKEADSGDERDDAMDVQREEVGSGDD